LKIGFTEDAENYKFSDEHKFELIFHKEGFIISRTTLRLSKIDFYDYKEDKVIKKDGYKRTSNFYGYYKKLFFIKKDSTLKQTLPLI